MTGDIAHHGLAHRARADVGAEIYGGPVLLDEGEVLAERAPWIARIRLLAERDLRPRRVHFTGDFAGDPLSDLGNSVGSAQDLELGMAEHVDESRRHDLVVRVDHAARAQARDRRPYIGDAIPDRRNTAPIPWVPGSVDYTRIGDENIVARSSRLHGRARRRECDRQ